tara:strand:- start:3157 stop:4224 length:1068 start_codon:yes stop_codon:yes gene_type:complete
MTLFDTKEEVIDIELTQYGKNLFARRRFKPTFYAFFDDDILYDSLYAGFNEIQNATEGRIKNETPRPHTQYVFAGIEENISKMTPAEGPAKVTVSGDGWVATSTIPGHDFGPGTFELQPQVQNEYALGTPLGQSSLTSKYAPAWEVNYFHGEMSSSVGHISGSGLAYFQVPQLSSVIDYNTYLTTINESGELTKNYIPDNLKNLILEEEEPKELGILLNKEEGGSTPKNIIQTKPDFLLLEVLENNADFWKENFDIEVFIIRQDLGENNRKTNTQQQLYFYDPKADLEVSPNHVEYYFDINVDEEIPTRYFCAADVTETKKKNLLADGMRVIDCPDIDGTRDLYKKKLEDPGEPC